MINSSDTSLNSIKDGEVSDINYTLLTFLVNNKLFAISIEDIIQIIAIQDIIEVPSYPSYAKGIINVRGNIVPVLDLSMRIEEKEKKYDEKTSIVITVINNKAIGLIVDKPDEVISITSSSITSANDISNSDIDVRFLKGVTNYNNKDVFLIDTVKLLPDDVINEGEVLC